MKKAITILLGIATAILLGMLMLQIQGYQPLESYGCILQYSIFSGFGLSNTINRTAILVVTGISAALALGSGASNLGQFGQLLCGAITATVIGLFVNLPGVILIPLMLVCGAAAGALYAGVAAAGRKYFGMNEFIITLMLNFIADYFTQYLVTKPLLDPKSSWPMSKVLPGNALMPALGSLDSSVFLVAVVFVFMIIYIKRTRQGYEMRIMGQNGIFAKTGGCETDRNFVRVMLYSGALAGFAGVLLIIGAGQQNRFLPALGQGFANDGLMVSIISGNSVPGVIIYALLFSILQSGSTGMQMDTGVPSEFTTILIAITVLSVVAFRSYSGIFVDKLAAIRKARSLKREVTR